MEDHRFEREVNVRFDTIRELMALCESDGDLLSSHGTLEDCLRLVEHVLFRPLPTPDHIKEAGIQAIQNNDTKYTPSAGTVELRKAICQRLKADCGLDYDFKDIAVSNGAKTCVYVALRALVNPGDEVILPAPYWVSYIELIRMVGGGDMNPPNLFLPRPRRLLIQAVPRQSSRLLDGTFPIKRLFCRIDTELIKRNFQPFTQHP